MSCEFASKRAKWLVGDRRQTLPLVCDVGIPLRDRVGGVIRDGAA